MNMRRFWSGFAPLLLVVLVIRPAAQASQSNFQIIPPPIAYPYFEPDRTDFRITGAKFDLTSSDDQVDLSGGGAYLILRRSINERVAIDGVLGAFGASGEVPGFALPFLFGINIFNPVNIERGDLSGFAVPLALNLELQAIRRPGGSLIFFGGPNLSFANFTVNTPYQGQSGATLAARTNFETQASVVLGGVQGGVQAGINLGPFTVSPFYMFITQSGSASFTFDNGYRSTDQIQGEAVDIEPFIINSYGADIIYRPWNLSIGTVLQSAGSTTEQEGYKLALVQVTWHFRGK